MSPWHKRLRQLPLAVVLTMTCCVFAQPTPLGAKTGGALVGDMDLDQIYRTRDLNGDGDADDAGEAWVFFDAANASGLPSPTNAVYTIFQAADGYVYYGDGGSHAVYRLRDVNGDGDAQDPGEASIWFSEADNYHGFIVTNPNGLYQDSAGATYVVHVGTSSLPDAIFRTVDLNGDGDANDQDEATLWMDTQNLLTSSSAFSLVFIGTTAYFADLMAGDPDAIFRAEDADASGAIDAGEFNIFIDETNPYGVQIGTGLVTDGVSLFISESLVGVNPQKVFQLTDLNGSGTIDSASEAVEVWNETHVPPGYELGSSYYLAIGPGGELLVSSAGTDIRDNVFRLVHLDFDGDFFDPGETIVWRSAHGGAFIEYARSLEYIVLVGDANCDGSIDFDDINPFVLALADPDAYGAQFPDCRLLNADCDFDGAVTFDDINAFVGLLSGG